MNHSVIALSLLHNDTNNRTKGIRRTAAWDNVANMKAIKGALISIKVILLALDLLLPFTLYLIV